MLVALLLFVQQPKTITFTHPCAHSAVVLEALGREMGVPMKPTGSVMRDYILLRFEKVPVDEALKKMAEVLNATWTESNGVRYLGRTKQQEDAGKIELQLRLEKSIAHYIENDALKVSTWNSARALDLVRNTIGPNGEMDRTAASTATNAKGPCRELLDEFIRTIGAKKLAALPEGTEVVFRWAPKQGEERVPTVLRTKADAFVRNISTFGTAIQSLGVPLNGDYDLPGEVRLASGNNVTPDWIAFRARVGASGIYVYMSPNGSNPSSYAGVSIGAKRDPASTGDVPGLEGSVVASELAHAAAFRIRQAANNLGNRLDAETEVGKMVIAWFEKGLDPDPVQLMAGEAVLQIAEKADRNVVAVLSDGFASGYFLARFVNSPLADVLKELVRLGDTSVDDNWITVTASKLPFQAHRMDRAAVARLALDTYKEGWPSIDMLAAYASHCEGDIAWQEGRWLVSVLQPVPYNFIWLVSKGAVASYRLYDSLPTSAKKQAHKEWLSIPVTDLPKNVQACLATAMTSNGFGEVPDWAKGDRWGDPASGAYAGQKERTAQDLVRALFEVRVERREFLSAQLREVGNGVPSSGLLTLEEASQRYLNSRDDQNGKLDYGTLAALTSERLSMRVKLADGSVLEFHATTDSRNSETRYYPIAEVPGEIGDKLRAEVKRLGGGQPNSP